MRTSNGKDQSGSLERTQGSQEANFDSFRHIEAGRVCSANQSDNKRGIKFFGCGGTTGERTIFPRYRNSVDGGSIRRLLNASEERLAGIKQQQSLLIAQKENLEAQIDLLNRLEQQEQRSLEETKQFLADWEDSISATLPIIKDAHTTN